MSRRCKHDPRNPRLNLSCAVPANLPELCRLAFDACDRIVLERNKFPELGNGRGQRRLLFTEPDRERRSQRLEAIALVARSVFLHMDVLTLRSGKTRRNGSCDAIDEAQMMKETKLGRDRVQRAKRDLVAANFITWHQPIRAYRDAETDEKRWRSFPAVLTVTLSFLVKLGITTKTVKELQRGTYEWKKSFPTPMGDIRDMRLRRAAIRAQELAAKHAVAATQNASRIVTASAARVAKLYGRKNE